MDPQTDSMGLKVGELLKEVQLDHFATKTLDRAVSSIKEAIKAIPDREVSLKDALGFVRDLGVPSDKVEFTFKSPELIQIGGSYAIGAVAKPEVNVDLIVRMPKDVAQNLQSVGVLLCDASGHFNLTFRMTKAAFSELQEEAS